MTTRVTITDDDFGSPDEPLAASGDPAYDLLYGGGIDPYELLEDPDKAAAVADAARLLVQFLDAAEESGALGVF